MKNGKRILTKSIVTVIIAVLLMPMCIQVISNAETITMSSFEEMEYSINSDTLYRFSEQTNRYNNLYCLNGGAHRGIYDVLTSGGSIYNINETNKNLIFTSNEKYNSAMWLIDNMYIAKDADAATKAMMIENISNVVKAKREVIEKTYNIQLDNNWIDGMMQDYAGREDLIYTVQQCALWYYTNNLIEGIGFMDESSVKSSAIIPGDGRDNSTPYTSTKYYRYICTAMIYTAMDHRDYVSPNTDSMQKYIDNVTLDSTTAKVDRVTGKVGPFIIQNDNKPVPEFKKYTVMVNNKVLAQENYDLIKNQNTIYIQLKNGYKLEDAKEYSINLKVDLKMLSTDAQYFYTEGNLRTEQPLINLKKGIVSKTIEGRAKTAAVAEFDLHLIKNITDVYSPVVENGTTKYILSKTDKYNQKETASVLTSRTFGRLGTLKNGATTDVYLTNKAFVTIPTGSIVKYKISIHNEGDLNGFAEEITDNLANGIEFVPYEDLKKYGIDDAIDYGWIKTDAKTNNVSAAYKTDYLSKAKNENNVIKSYDASKDAIDTKEVYIYCKVTSKNENDILKNVAEITADRAYDAKNEYKDIEDRDSKPGSITLDKLTTDINEWTGTSEYSPEQMAENGTYSVPGIQDDDDYENVRVQTIDLALRKYISAVNGKNVVHGVDLTSYNEKTSRIPKITSASETARQVSGTAEYFHGKEAIDVCVGDEITYTMRVYNEGGTGDYDGIATEITDYLPEGLEFVKLADGYEDYTASFDKDINAIKISYNGNGIIKTNTIKDIAAATDAKEYSKINKNWYQEVAVICKATTYKKDQVLTNRAEITAQKAFLDNGQEVKTTDKDSVPNSLVGNIETNAKKIEVLNLSNYYNTYKYGINDSYITYYKGVEGKGNTNSKNQDDTDFENVKVKRFDLALRKFITEVTDNGKNTEITNRYPEFKIDEKGNYVYEHTKEPVMVDTNNIVTYTLRIYNEGELNGYAKQVLDDIPDGLEFVPYTVNDGSVNDTYRWIMYKVVTDEEIAKLPEGTEVKEFDATVKDENKQFKKCIVTTNPSEADYIVTDYLSCENGKKLKLNNSTNANLLKAFDSQTMKQPDYRDIKVQFKVTEPSTSERTIINLAQITDDSDEYDEKIDDMDSNPNVWINGEDDQDIEKIKVRYFDLALVKWVSEATVIEDGVEKITPGNTLENLQNQYDHRLIYANHQGDIGNYSDLEPVIKVDIPKNKLGSVVVKFKYKIRVYNEGQIDGYAKEITDYIPKNMKFVQEDNPLWKDAGDGKVITDQLANTLLKVGGQPETVEIVYTWINGENNIGLLVNVAEISKDYNEHGTPDIDSKPGNYEENEDDIDDAAVILSVRTGKDIPVAYIVIGLTVVCIISFGAVLIKKYVL